MAIDLKSDDFYLHHTRSQIVKSEEVTLYFTDRLKSSASMNLSTKCLISLNQHHFLTPNNHLLS